MIGRLKHLRLETVFIILFAAFSLVCIVSIPPGWNVDEANHTYRMYQLASGHLYAQKVITPGTGLKAYGGQVPANLVQLFNQTGSNQPGWIGDPHNQVASGWYKRHSGIYSLKDDGRRVSYNFSGSALYSPITYILTLPVVWLGVLVNLPFFWVMILGRLIDAMAVGLVFYLAIKYMPVGKWIFFTVGLLPSLVMQASTMGADAPQLVFTTLFILLVARHIYNPKPLRWWTYLLFLGLGIGIAITKFAYAPLVLFLLALPLVQPLYRQRKTFLLLVAVVVGAIIPSLVWTHLVSYIDINSTPLANYGVQERYIFTQPFTYIRTLYYTFFTNQQQPLGNLFGSFIILPAIYTYLGAAIVTLCLFVRDKRETLALKAPAMRRWRLALWLTTGLTAMAITTALYIYSNPVHATSVISIQARYFLPILPLVLLALYGNVVKNQRVIKTVIVAISCFLLLGTGLMIYHRLYQTNPPPPLIQAA